MYEMREVEPREQAKELPPARVGGGVKQMEIIVLCFYIAGSLCFLAGSVLTLWSKL